MMRTAGHSPGRPLRRAAFLALWLLLAFVTSTVTYALLVFGGH